MQLVLAVARKEMRQIVRDRRTVMILAFVPAFFLLVFGYALNFDVKNVKLAVEDRDGTADSRSLVSAFVNSGYFDHAGAAYDPASVERMLDRNDARAVLVIPERFSETLTSGGIASVQVIVNGDNANTATAVIGYATSILQTASAQLGGTIQMPISVKPRIW